MIRNLYMQKKILLWVLVMLLIVLGLVFYWGWQQNQALLEYQQSPVTKSEQGSLDKSKPEDAQTVSELSTYTNEESGLIFEYPKNLQLIEVAGVPHLKHTINYPDPGCDMSGEAPTSPTLDDFHISFEILSGSSKVTPPYNDGDYAAGVLKGTMAYQGVEGCGETKYYFPLPDGRQLVVTDVQVQALSGIVSLDLRDKILTTPGAISNEESDKILRDILTSVRVLKK